MTGAHTGRVAARRLTGVLVWLLPVLLALFAYRTSLGFGLVGDAVPLIEQNPLMRAASNLGAMATRDYFWSPAGEAIGYWRPVTKVSWLLETLAGEGRPWVYHAVQLAWLAVAVAGVATLGAAVGLGPLASSLAAAAYGLHPVTIEPTALVMARSDLVCGAASVWAVVAWLRWVTVGGAGWLAFHILALLVAFGSKEAAIVLLPVLAVWSLPGFGPQGARGKVHHLAPVVGIALIYLLLRWRLLGVSGSVPFSPDPLRLFVGIGAFLKALVPAGFATGLRNLSFSEAASAPQLASAGLAWLVAALLGVWSWGRWRPGLPLLAWIGGACAIVLVVGPMRVPGAAGRIALADRWLFAALAPGVILAAGVAARLPTRIGRATCAAAAAIWILVLAAAAPRLHAPYGDRFGLLDLEDAQYLATPERYRVPTEACRHAERALVRAARAGDLDAALAIRERLHAAAACTDTVNADLTVLALLLARGRTAAALPVAEALSRPGVLRGRVRARGLALVAETLHVNGRAPEALALLESGWQERRGDCALGGTLARALAAAGRERAAAAVLAETRRCEGFAAKDTIREP